MVESRLRVLSIFGTRPEAVKMAPVVQQLSRNPSIESVVCVTAQHREMLDQTLKLFDIQPDYDLDLMKPDQSLDDITAAVFTDLGPVIKKVDPHWAVIQGDTTTVMAAALSAYYHGVAVGHVEAGLRTGDKWQPFPEEINRRVVTTMADLNFAPTQWAKDNLLREGVESSTILVTGNTVIDALHSVIKKPYNLWQDVLKGVDRQKRILLVTAHRRENLGAPMEGIFKALLRIAKDYSHQVELVYPVHMNPNVTEHAYRILSGVPNIHLIQPLDYLPMVHLMKHAYLVLTDSGGLQEEAPALGTPVLVLREVTERPEAIEAGTAILVGTDPDLIVETARKLLDNPREYAHMAEAHNPFGDGHASERIVTAILESSKG